MKSKKLNPVNKNLLDREKILLDVGIYNTMKFMIINDFLDNFIELGET